MNTKITETYTAYLMGIFLGTLNREGFYFKSKKMHWTAEGSEAIVEFQGQFYKVRIEPFSSTDKA